MKQESPSIRRAALWNGDIIGKPRQCHGDDMPCSDSSSSIAIKLDREEKFLSFEYAKITCGQEITAQTGLSEYLKGKSLLEIIDLAFPQVTKDLNTPKEEAQFILYLEWAALRSAIAQYLGKDDEELDAQRCQIASIDYTHEGIEIAEIILPPKEMPKIVSCGITSLLSP